MKNSQCIEKLKKLWQAITPLGMWKKTLTSDFNAVEGNNPLILDRKNIKKVGRFLFKLSQISLNETS